MLQPASRGPDPRQGRTGLSDCHNHVRTEILSPQAELAEDPPHPR